MNIPDAAVQAAYSASYGKIGFAIGKKPSEVMRAALTAAYPHLPLGYEVKKLEWDKNSEKEEWYGGAQNELVGINEYNIFAHPCATGLFVLDVMGNRCEDDFTSVETAKAAAQSDFERRVRECIVAKPVDVAAVREQCAQIAQSWEETAINIGQHVEASIANDIKLSIRALSAEPAQGDNISVSDAAKALRSENNMRAIQDACDGICKVYRFRDVLDRLAAPTPEAGR